MTLLHRSLIAIAISTTLSACYTDVEPTVPFPNDPEPLLPLPSEKFSLEVGESTVEAMKESVVITTLAGEEKRVNVETFKGIEYATQTRFEHSDIKELDETVDATEFGAACMQNRATVQEQNEDCLNLNIWRPAGVEADADLPVYVFIHGGDFEYGAGSEALVHGDTVVAQGSDDGKPFIYVSFNYRLGHLGTQWVEGENTDGNYGIGDQKTALEWVHNNIDKFGGDTQKVTVMGQGSGAMSIGFLQQDEDVSGYYFQRAIMQSNPYGFEYPSYDVAKDRSKGFTAGTDITEIMESQRVAVGGIDQLANWLLNSLSLVASVPVMGDIELRPESDNTPMSTLMPFSPYIGCTKLDDSPAACKTANVSPLNDKLTVPTVLGTNAQEANSFGMLFSVTFLAPMVIHEILGGDDLSELVELTASDDPNQVAMGLTLWLQDPKNIALLKQRISSMNVEDISTQLTLPDSAYRAVTNLYFGVDTNMNTMQMALCVGIDGESLTKFFWDYLLGRVELGDIVDLIKIGDLLSTISCLADGVEITAPSQTEALLNLADFYPNSEASFGGATTNMKQFKTLLNDTLFDGPARHMAANSENQATLYRFDHKPSFNMWNYMTGWDDEKEEYNKLSIIDLFKTIGCIAASCNGSELPFVFNKSLRFDGSEVYPSKSDKALMNEMSRLWFSDDLFNNYQYDSSDNVLVIDGEGFTTAPDWDYVTNPGVDPKLREGRLTGLEEQGLMPWQWYLN
ncbi:carboxylesterase family protein [Vibrio superstes]|uniref:Carboxylesterase type B domain-containing protein n=1 Tax=Vibrio superstes NBRC 103154 TaxID=1219062 RepID=A0A511QKH8_9VIBR|nr:carboxylesterase family protein [Vibrio superstes]GEM77791.1 hypothetical protein VSU01S_00360 [Vibrio superstes NBRC 103154]